jgi:hypothetical protein
MPQDGEGEEKMTEQLSGLYLKQSTGTKNYFIVSREVSQSRPILWRLMKS